MFGISRCSRSVSVIAASIVDEDHADHRFGRVVAVDERRRGEEQPDGELGQRDSAARSWRRSSAPGRAAAASRRPGRCRRGRSGSRRPGRPSAASTIEMPRGTRWATAVAKLPTIRPARNANTVQMAVVMAGVLPERRLAGAGRRRLAVADDLEAALGTRLLDVAGGVGAPDAQRVAAAAEVAQAQRRAAGRPGACGRGGTGRRSRGRRSCRRSVKRTVRLRVFGARARW